MQCSQEFHQWMHQVDVLCLERFGLSIHDLPERSFREAYDGGLTPTEFMDCEECGLESLLR